MPRTVSPVTRGFTVVELLVVLAAIGLLLAVAAPRYVQHIDRAREVALRQDLFQMREAIDKFYGDQQRYPATLGELVTRRYLRQVPEDPLTGSVDSWVTQATPASATPAGVVDVHSGAAGVAQDGSAYASW